MKIRNSKHGNWLNGNQSPVNNHQPCSAKGSADGELPITNYQSAQGGAQPKGLTLIELLISMAITTVIMLAIGSSMLIATRALPDADSPANAVITASEIAEQLAAELQFAVTFTERTATAVEFTVADRNGDETPEIIRYAWSGISGDPLTRQYNAGTIVKVLDSVQEFNLSYDTETISEQTTSKNESAETLLAEYNSLDVWYNPESQQNLWPGQYLMPSLPDDTISWKVTKVACNIAKSAKVDGEVSVELQLPTAQNVPDGVMLESWTLLESTLTADYERQEFAVSNVSGLSPDQGICLVFRWVAGNLACIIQGQNQNIKPENGNLVESTDQGASWSSYTNRTLLYALYGTVTTPGEPEIQETYYVRAVQIKIRKGNDQQSAVYTGTNVLNKPEVTP